MRVERAWKGAMKAVNQLLQPGRAWSAVPAQSLMQLKSKQPARDQLQPYLSYLDDFADALQPVGVAHKAVGAILSVNPAAAGPHTKKSVLWHTFVAPVADAVDVALLLLKPLLRVEGPLPHDHMASLLTTLWSAKKSGDRVALRGLNRMDHPRTAGTRRDELLLLLCSYALHTPGMAHHLQCLLAHPLLLCHRYNKVGAPCRPG